MFVVSLVLDVLLVVVEAGMLLEEVVEPEPDEKISDHDGPVLVEVAMMLVEVLLVESLVGEVVPVDSLVAVVVLKEVLLVDSLAMVAMLVEVVPSAVVLIDSAVVVGGEVSEGRRRASTLLRCTSSFGRGRG